MKILVLNCGSSSIKYKLYNIIENKVLAKGYAERIGMAGSKLRHVNVIKDNIDVNIEKTLSGHQEALETIIFMLIHKEYGVIGDMKDLGAVGHRVVHGGEEFHQPVVVDDDVLKTLEECNKLAPLHNPPNILGIRVCQRLIPGALQVAVFDTAFHQTIQDYAYIYALPFEYYDTFRLRKYGFHGTSHKYVSRRAAEIVGKKVEELKMITCHLGNGASLCAVGGGKSLDTTMGFTPLAGIVMGTRCGDVDPAVISYLSERQKLSSAEIMEILNKKSGVLGVSGISSDFRDLEQAAREGCDRARLALDIFVYSVTKAIGSFIATLGGLDTIVFTAGIGENSSEIRARLCANLKYMNIKIDEQKNSLGGREIIISTLDSNVQVLVIPTDEEKMIAMETKELVAKIYDDHAITKTQF